MNSLGIDIGGTKVAVGHVMTDGSGFQVRSTVREQRRGAVDANTNEGGIASIFRVVDDVLSSLDRPIRDSLTGIGVACAGNVDTHTGVLRRASNMAWHDLPLATVLQSRYGLPVRVENDVNAAAWGAFVHLHPLPPPVHDIDALGALPTVAYLTVGTGIGGGVVAAGRILRGRTGSAGELGHLPGIAGAVDPAAGSVICTCGSRGCLEAVASGPAFARTAQDAVRRGEAHGLRDRVHGDLTKIDPAQIFGAAVDGDAHSRALVDREGQYIALAIAVAWRAWDPDVVVLGGGVMNGGAVIIDAVHTALANLSTRDASRLRNTQEWVRIAPNGDDAGIIGAASLVIRPPAE